MPEDSTNLCYIAADIFSEYNIQDRVNITINKKIPVGGGLGGGSSNASTILKDYLNCLTLILNKNYYMQFLQKLEQTLLFSLMVGCNMLKA